MRATRDLMASWHETKASWQDAKSREFEEQYLADLMASVERTMPVFDKIEKLLGKAREDCE